jgi:hypothetical protein
MLRSDSRRPVPSCARSAQTPATAVITAADALSFTWRTRTCTFAPKLNRAGVRTSEPRGADRTETAACSGSYVRSDSTPRAVGNTLPSDCVNPLRADARRLTGRAGRGSWAASTYKPLGPIHGASSVASGRGWGHSIPRHLTCTGERSAWPLRPASMRARSRRTQSVEVGSFDPAARSVGADVTCEPLSWGVTGLVLSSKAGVALAGRRARPLGRCLDRRRERLLPTPVAGGRLHA